MMLDPNPPDFSFLSAGITTCTTITDFGYVVLGIKQRPLYILHSYSTTGLPVA